MNNWSGCSMASAPDTTREETAEPPDIDEHLVSLLAPVSFEAGRYRVLAHMIELRHKDIGLHVLGSPVPQSAMGRRRRRSTWRGLLPERPSQGSCWCVWTCANPPSWIT